MTDVMAIEDVGRLRVLRLNRPERKNALSRELLAALNRVFRDAANDDDVARAQVLSLHASEDDAIGERLVSSAPDPQAVLEHREQLTYLMEAIAELPERLRLVVEQYFLAERPMSEIAATLGVTESRISQLRAEALVLLSDGTTSGTRIGELIADVFGYFT